MRKPPTVGTITVTIESNGPAVGKTTLQLLLAEFLYSKGCSVLLSDDSVSEHVFKRDIIRYAKIGKPTVIEPVKVVLHVTGIPAADRSHIHHLYFRDIRLGVADV